MPRIVFGSTNDLIETILGNKKVRGFMKVLQDLRRTRRDNWHQQYGQVREALEKHLRQGLFFLPLPNENDKRPRLQVAVNFQAKLPNGQANSWDIAPIPDGAKMTDEEIKLYVQGLVDGSYTSGYFLEHIKAVIPVRLKDSVIPPEELPLPDPGAGNSDELFDDVDTRQALKEIAETVPHPRAKMAVDRDILEPPKPVPALKEPETE